MKMHYTFKNMDPSDALKVFTQAKCERLEKYFRGRLSITWIFSQERQNQIAHCHLVGNNMDYFAEGVTDNIHSAIEVALDKMEKQLRKHKEIVKDHLHKNHRVSAA